MKAMRIVTTVCWLVTALALAGLAIWFLTGTVFGIRSERWNNNWLSGINIGGWESLTGPYEVVGTYSVATAGINSLNIDWISGDITIKPHNGAEIQITEYAQRELQDNEKLQISTSGNTLTVKFRQSGNIGNMPMKRLEVLVPYGLSENLARLSVDTTSGGIFIDSINANHHKTDSMSGSIQISNATAHEMDISSTSGSITLTSVHADDMEVESMSGALRISDSSARTLNCDTTSGSITVSGAFSSINADSLSGRISIDNSAARSILNAESTSGSLNLSGDFDRVDADSLSGSISVRSTTIPSSLKADTT